MYQMMLTRVICTARPRIQRNKTYIRYKLKKAIEHAQTVCFHFEDSVECRIAWDEVNDLTRALHDQYPQKPEISIREYDV